MRDPDGDEVLVNDEKDDKEILAEFEFETDTVTVCVIEPLDVNEDTAVAERVCFSEAVSVIEILGDDEAEGEGETVTVG